MGGWASCGFLIGMKNSLPIRWPRPSENTAPSGAAPFARFATLVGLPLLRHGYGDTFSRCLSFSSRSPAATGGVGKRVNSTPRT